MNPETLVAKSSRACAPASAYRFSSESLTWEDCIRAKSKLSVAASYYVDYKYLTSHEGCILVHVDGNLEYKDSVLNAQKEGKEIALIGSLEPEIRQLMKRPKLSKLNRIDLYKMVKTALHESVRLERCDKCSGTAQRLKNGKLVECGRCSGSGRTVMRITELCKMLGVDRSNWSRSHLPKYQLFRNMFIGLQREFELEIRRIS